MRALVTGAGGFVGSHVVRELLDRGHDVRAAVRAAAGPALADVARRCEVVACDLWEASDAERARLFDSVDLCVHAAWYAVPGQYLASRENLRCLAGSLALLESMAGRCPRVVMIGSCFEYRFGPEPLRESDPVCPASVYAAAKTSLRHLGEQLARVQGTSFLWARLFYLYGPFEHARRLVPSVALALLRGQRVDVTSGRQVRDFLHVRDVASAVVAAARSPLEGVVNIGSGTPVTIRDIVASLERLVGGAGGVNWGARPDNPTDPPVVCADVARLTGATGWSPRFDLESGLADAVAWWKARGGAA